MDPNFLVLTTGRFTQLRKRGDRGRTTGGKDNRPSAQATRRRDGCSECKRKKVKCDLARPVCSRCTRFPKECRYEPNIIITSTPQPATSQRKSSATRPSRSAGPLMRRASPTARLPQQVAFVPSRFLSTSESRFFVHHFGTQTSAVLFPLAPPSFKERLVCTALDTPHLLYALLASACSHHARLVSDGSAETGRTILKFTNLAVAGLRGAMGDATEALKAETAMTAMTLCTNDVCDGNLHQWRIHLAGVKELLNAFLKKQDERSGMADPFVLFLAKWFATLDTSAGVSGLFENVAQDGRYWSVDDVQNPCTGYVDDFCGYSLELMPILARIGTLARLRHTEALSSNSEQAGFRSSENNILVDEHFAPSGDVPTGSDVFMNEIQNIESQILSLSPRTASEATSNSHDKTLAGELQNTHMAFVHAALLHLHRRVQLLSRHDPKVREDISNIIDSVGNIRPLSTANILTLWPMFSAGCETEDAEERDFIQNKMGHMRTLGMGNFTRAREVMRKFWASDTSLRWDEYLMQNGLDLVLF